MTVCAAFIEMLMYYFEVRLCICRSNQDTKLLSKTAGGSNQSMHTPSVSPTTLAEGRHCDTGGVFLASKPSLCEMARVEDTLRHGSGRCGGRSIPCNLRPSYGCSPSIWRREIMVRSLPSLSVAYTACGALTYLDSRFRQALYCLGTSYYSTATRISGSGLWYVDLGIRGVLQVVRTILYFSAPLQADWSVPVSLSQVGCEVGAYQFGVQRSISSIYWLFK